MKIAMINSESSNVVLEGIFALSSLLLQGPSKSESHKSRLISMLQRNVTKVDRESILQNLAATMLLYQCEVHQDPQMPLFFVSILTKLGLRLG